MMSDDVVFESPDGGRSIYSRRIGSSNRILIWEDPDHIRGKNKLDRYVMWKDILEESETNIALRDAIEKAEMIYALVKKEKY